MSGAFSEDQFYGVEGRSPLDEVGRAAFGGLKWSGGAALTFGALLLVTGLGSFPAVIILAGLLMAVWVVVSAFVGLMRGLSA